MNSLDRVKIVDGIIEILPRDGVETYQIPLDRIEKPEHLLGWLWHLSQKTWFDAMVTDRLIVTVCSAKNWPLLTPTGS